MRVLIITNDLLSERMASPAIRCWEMAKVIGKKYKTTLACSNNTIMQNENFEVRSFMGETKKLIELALEHEIIIIHPYTLSLHPGLGDIGKILIMDLFAPFILEKLESFKEEKMDERLYIYDRELQELLRQVCSCDYFLCASDIQKRFWGGMLSSLFISGESTLDLQREILNRIIVLPFGISEEAPNRKEKPLSNKLRSSEDDFILIWGGGIWNWFDTTIVIDGMKALKERRPNVKLFFMSAKHPHPAMPHSQHRLLYSTIEEAEKADLINKNIFFNDRWISYQERSSYLLDADAGLSTHHNHLETRYSFRTRILDYIWCKLPIICTEGDYLSKLVKEEEIGMTIPEHDVDSFVNAVIELSTSRDLFERCKKNLENLAPEFYWDKLVESLLGIFDNPTLKPFSPANRGELSKYIYLPPLSGISTKREDKIKRSFYFLKYEGFSAIKRKLLDRS
ncbi:hypothetical protein KKB18_13895 [bacterium]|nr:hypothetical protein [bacterium]